MERQKIIIIAVAALIVLGAGGFALIKLQKPVVAPTIETAISESTPTPATQKSSLKSLLEKGGNVTCTVKQSSGSGTVFVSEKKFAGDFITKIEGKDTLSHIIYDGTTSYIWTDGANTGFKMKVDPSQMQNQGQNQQSVDLNQEVETDCKSWTPDNSKFTAPSNITFTDLSSLVPKASASSSTGTKVNTAICDQIADATARQNCIKALSGN